MFEEVQQDIGTIGNEKLNSQLVDLANLISNKKENEKKKKMADCIKEFYSVYPPFPLLPLKLLIRFIKIMIWYRLFAIQYVSRNKRLKFFMAP